MTLVVVVRRLSTQAIGRIHRYGQLKTAHVVHLLTHATKDIEVFEERNDVVVEAVVEAQQTQRGEIVNPPRSKKHQFAKKVKAEKKAAAAKGKVKAKVDSDDDEVLLAASDDNEKKPVKKAAAAAVPKVSPARAKGKGKGKAAIVELASDSEVEFESDAESSAAEEAMSDDESDAVSTADEATEVRPLSRPCSRLLPSSSC